MDLSYSDEQRLLGESANNLLAARAQKPGATELWKEMADMGWLALPLPESDGGLGQGIVDVAIVTEAMGRHRARSNYVAGIVLAGGLVATLGNDAQRAALLPGLADGSLRLALAHAEEGARYNLAHVATTAKKSGAGWVLDGRKIAVLGGDVADRLIVSARVSGGLRDETGIALFVVARGAKGVTVDGHATVDGAGAARVTLSGVEVGADALLSDNAFAAIQHAYDRSTAAFCSELVGLMEAATAATVDYTKIRIQFGKPLAVNQTLRHRMADMSIACEEARSMALRAALHADDDDARSRGRAVAGAWAKVSRAARFVAEQSIQLHGGMGVTNELEIGGYLKRVVALDAIIGGPDLHLRRHAALSTLAA
ncbi:MAG: acyl-CoA dehydrogenase family protein [Rhodoblastus sp.]|nr:acyl-CoA dehydrogenase family protein [Rhodoblastus sp.]